jgi:hypothetical protein
MSTKTNPQTEALHRAAKDLETAVYGGNNVAFFLQWATHEDSPMVILEQAYERFWAAFESYIQGKVSFAKYGRTYAAIRAHIDVVAQCGLGMTPDLWVTHEHYTNCELVLMVADATVCTLEATYKACQEAQALAEAAVLAEGAIWDPATQKIIELCR